MTIHHQLVFLPCADSDEAAEACRRSLDLPRHRASALGHSAVAACTAGFYTNGEGQRVELREAIDRANAGKRSIAPDDALPESTPADFPQTEVQVRNETTLQAARLLVDEGYRPAALNFANGVHPGGGFLGGARAQEEVLCRSSALYPTLADDPMYDAHRTRPLPDSTDWVIYSPDVPVFREDDGTEIPAPWHLSVLTSAAPYAPKVGQPQSGDLLRSRIHRVLDVAVAHGHDALVLGAWGCGAFRNDPDRTARDFRTALDQRAGRFAKVIFAVTDWSEERRYLAPFRDALRIG